MSSMVVVNSRYKVSPKISIAKNEMAKQTLAQITSRVVLMSVSSISNKTYELVPNSSEKISTINKISQVSQVVLGVRAVILILIISV